MAEKPHILLTGGGTGGHLFPLVAIAQHLVDKAEVSIVIEHGDNTSHQAFDKLPVSIYQTRAGKFRRYHGRARWYVLHPTNVRENVRDSGRLVRGFAGSLRLLRRLQPDVVFVKGGYVALPVGLAAASLGIPIITHDSDVLPGLTNRIIARWAKLIAVGFPREHYKHYPARKLVHVGVPIRQEFMKLAGTHPKASSPHILIAGGSLGAHDINQLVLAVGKQLLEHAKVTHICGKHDFEAIRELTREWQASGRYRVYDFVGSELFSLVSQATLTVTRAGATTIAEFAASEVPMILIPNADLTGGHQLQNAVVLEDSAAAVVLGEPQLKAKPERLVKAVAELLAHPQKRAWLAKNAQSLFPPNAASRLAELLLEEARRRKRP